MQRINRNSVGQVLNAIHDSEIPARLEWTCDGGFTWSLIGERSPRLSHEEAVTEARRIIADGGGGAPTVDVDQSSEHDCIAGGNEPTIEDAVSKLACAIIKHLPESTFAKGWNGHEEPRET